MAHSGGPPNVEMARKAFCEFLAQPVDRLERPRTRTRSAKRNGRYGTIPTLQALWASTPAQHRHVRPRRLTSNATAAPHSMRHERMSAMMRRSDRAEAGDDEATNTVPDCGTPLHRQDHSRSAHRDRAESTSPHEGRMGEGSIR